MHREAEADVHVFIYVLVYSFLNICHVINYVYAHVEINLK